MASGTIKIRDPIHGFIEVPGEWARIVDTPTFQRLRGIRQLAFANHVYPGALHTRFDHTLGVFHIACQMAEALGITHAEKTREQRRHVELAALLHDLGHGPFSHVSENVLERFADRSKLPAGLKKEKIHELITADIIRQDKHIKKLGETLCKFVLSLLKDGSGHHSVLRDIVSGPLDADKQDYLLRDSYFCGVEYGRFDIHQLHRALRCAKSSGDEYLIVDYGGLHVIEQYVMAKYYMTSQVYRHKVRLITDQMITRALVLGIEEDEVDELRQLYTYDRTPKFIENYLQWDDSRLVNTFTDEAHRTKKVYDFLKRLQQRNLLKRAFFESLGSTNQEESDDNTESIQSTLLFEPRPRRALLSLMSPGADKRRTELEKQLAQVIQKVTKHKIASHLVIVHVYQLKSVREQARNDASQIQVGRSGVPHAQPQDFDQVSTLFKSIDERLNEIYIEVFAPLDYDTEHDKNEWLIKLHSPILEVLRAFR